MGMNNIAHELYSETKNFKGMSLDENMKGIIYSTLNSILDYHLYNRNIGNFRINYRWIANSGNLKVIFDIDIISISGEGFPCKLEFGV